MRPEAAGISMGIPVTTAQAHAPGTEVFLARQPIFDNAGKLHGYELLHRRGHHGGAETAVGDDQMSSEVIVNAFLSIGIAKLIGDALAHVNFSRRLLLDGVHRMLSPNQVVIELLHGIAPDQEVLAACRELVNGGFTLVVEDFAYRPEREPLYAMASIVKIDVLDKSPDELREIATKLKPFRTRLMAVRVETIAQRDTCIALGFTLFQGYFFSRPQVVAHRELPTAPVSILRLLTLLRDENSTEAELEKAFRGNMSLTVRLLRAVNSAAVGGRGIESIKQAIRLLGRTELNRWLALLLVTSNSSRSPFDDELMHIVMRRARMCETLAIATGDRRASDGYFIVGLFSLLDAILKAPMPELLREVDLSRDVNEALLERAGPYGPTLALVESFERGNWEAVSKWCHILGVQPDVVSEAFVDALVWAAQRIKSTHNA